MISVVAKHVWTSANGTVTLNDRTAWPRYIVAFPIRGLRSKADSDDNRDLNTEYIGERPLTGYARGKTVIYSGRVYGRTWLEMTQGVDELLDVFGADLTTGKVIEGRMVIDQTLSGAGSDKTFTAICRDAECTELRPPSPTHIPSPFVSEFTVDLRLHDPRIYDWNGTTASNPSW